MSAFGHNSLEGGQPSMNVSRNPNGSQHPTNAPSGQFDWQLPPSVLPFVGPANSIFTQRTFERPRNAPIASGRPYSGPPWHRYMETIRHGDYFETPPSSSDSTPNTSIANSRSSSQFDEHGDIGTGRYESRFVPANRPATNFESTPNSSITISHPYAQSNGHADMRTGRYESRFVPANRPANTFEPAPNASVANNQPYSLLVGENTEDHVSTSLQLRGAEGNLYFSSSSHAPKVVDFDEPKVRNRERHLKNLRILYQRYQSALRHNSIEITRSDPTLTCTAAFALARRRAGSPVLKAQHSLERILKEGYKDGLLENKDVKFEDKFLDQVREYWKGSGEKEKHLQVLWDYVSDYEDVATRGHNE